MRKTRRNKKKSKDNLVVLDVQCLCAVVGGVAQVQHGLEGTQERKHFLAVGPVLVHGVGGAVGGVAHLHQLLPEGALPSPSKERKRTNQVEGGDEEKQKKKEEQARTFSKLAKSSSEGSCKPGRLRATSTLRSTFCERMGEACACKREKPQHTDTDKQKRDKGTHKERKKGERENAEG